ncbi:MAG TPA: DUF4214 domain-containing protein [Hyphomonadaceae bacterium]|nr:DUF4214 domain-containing protein [Hyphomonadaceae bacterium]HPN06963.1 DUF4214 domain-containing protein [Hyphomonadaceae bacterium]
MKSGWLIVVAAAAALSACGDPAQQLATAKPASGPALVKYSRNATAEVSLGANADLVQRFCQNQTGKPCASDIAAELKSVGFDDHGPTNELGDAFAKIEADKIDGTPDQQSSDEVYVEAAYHVALGRAPEVGAVAAQSKALKDGVGRVAMMRSFIQSTEFKALP